MFKSLCMFLCISFFVVGAYGNCDFIDKCLWSDKACLLASSRKVLPKFVAGIPEFGVPTFEPLIIDKTLKVDEAGLKLAFKDMKLTGLSKCNILNVERDSKKSYIKVELECPIDVRGTYEASGTLVVSPVEGNGPFQVETKKVYISVKVYTTLKEGSNGEKHYKLGKFENTHEFKEKVHLKFENLYNGDQEKAATLHQFLDQNWKDVVSFGNPIVNELVKIVVLGLDGMFKHCLVSELELE